MILRRAAAALLLAGGLGAPAVRADDTARVELPPRSIVVYHESWLERPATGAVATTLVMTPAYVGAVILSFAKPDMTYAGDLDLSGTGLEYRFDGGILRDAIARLKLDNPGIKVLLGLGGAAYANDWPRFDAAAMGRLVRDLGANGIDLDYEPPKPDCTTSPADGRISCATDEVWRDLVRRIRAELPRPYFLAVPVWSVGAYGEDAWRDARPRSPHTGVMLGFLRSPEAAAVDLITIMAYDAGPTFDPVEAYRAYRAAWPGPLALGIQVPPSPQGGPEWTLGLTSTAFRQVLKEDPGAHAMLYGMLARPDLSRPGAPATPSGRELMRALCVLLEKTGCAP